MVTQLCHWPISPHSHHLFHSLSFVSFSSGGNNRRFNQRDNQRDFRGGSDFNNQSNYNNNRYQNGESSERGGGNWNSRGGARTFSRGGGDPHYGNPPPPQQDQPPQHENGAEGEQPVEPVNTRWQEPAQQEYNNRGGGYGGKWNSRGNDVDYTVPLPRDERIELELFGKLSLGFDCFVLF